MLHHVRDLTQIERLTLEGLVGRSLSDQESLAIRPVVVVKQEPIGIERDQAFQKYLASLTDLAERVRDIPQSEIDLVIDDALHAVRRNSK